MKRPLKSETLIGSYGKKRYRFCGKERDEESGLYYYGARYYMPWQCRFVSMDPLAGEYPFYTPYQYAGNKPVNKIDIDGLEEDGDVTQKDPEVVPEITPLYPGTNIFRQVNSAANVLADNQTTNGIKGTGNLIIALIDDKTGPLVGADSSVWDIKFVNNIREAKQFVRAYKSTYDVGINNFVFRGHGSFWANSGGGAMEISNLGYLGVLLASDLQVYLDGEQPYQFDEDNTRNENLADFIAILGMLNPNATIVLPHCRAANCTSTGSMISQIDELSDLANSANRFNIYMNQDYSSPFFNPPSNANATTFAFDIPLTAPLWFSKGWVKSGPKNQNERDYTEMKGNLQISRDSPKIKEMDRTTFMKKYIQYLNPDNFGIREWQELR